MSDELYRLVYYSRNQLETETETGDFEAQVADILARSRHNNQRDDITGALLFNAGCFAQVLEGPLGNVEAAFERIQQDERHGEVSLLTLEPIAARSFPNWAMGFVGERADTAERFARVGLESGFDPSRLSGDHIHTVLKDLVIEEEATAA
ncbi:MAG: hypothetical protein JWL91_1507 [Sphingomonas bacterium]|jgi:hypothetical protein|nr:BLUF domain-containing protein [Sphingomonas bacterium]MDB5689631.1 hypothetical protein [Sphingomonas bacterium]